MHETVAVATQLFKLLCNLTSHIMANSIFSKKIHPNRLQYTSYVKAFKASDRMTATLNLTVVDYSVEGF